MRDVFLALTAALDARRDLVFCSLVETRGSTPQKAGAVMLVYPDGSQAGTLGGGCVEAEVKRRALRFLHSSGKPEILTFNLDDNYGWDDGLICGGRMSILADPLTASARSLLTAANYYRRYREQIDSGAGCTEAVVIEEGPGLVLGSRYLFDAQGNLLAWLGREGVPEAVRRNLLPLPQRPAPAVRQGIAFLPTYPRISVLIVGGGHVGQAVARLAAEVDFDVWVLDDREQYANPQRFPSASKIMVGPIGETLRRVAQELISPSVYALIVTRGHNHDEEALYHLAPTSAGYVGMIGSKRKIRLIYEDLIARGISEEMLARVHAPLGLDIGSRTVPEIAVSIVAELIAKRNLGKPDAPPRVRVKPGTTRS